MPDRIILFDGECNLCNNFIRFIIKHDKKQFWRFSPLQSSFSKKLSKKYHFNSEQLDSVYVIKNNILYNKSNAVLTVLTNLGGIWNLSYIFYLLPVKLREYFYLRIAKNRFRFFGKSTSCMLPPYDLSEYFKKRNLP